MGVALLAAVCTISLQALRVYFPIVFDGFEDAGYVPAAAVVVGVPALGAILGAAFRQVIGHRRSLILGVGLLATGRIALQVAGAIPFWLAAITVAAAFWALMAIVATGFAGRARGPVQGLLLGFAVDVAIRSLFHGWDPVWQDGVLPWVVAVSLSLGPMILVIVSSRRVRIDGSSVSWIALVAIGPFLFLHALFLQSAPFVAARSGVSSLRAVAIILALDAAAILVVGAFPRWQITLAAMSVVGVVGLRLAPGAGVLIFVALACGGTAAMLVLALRSSGGRGRILHLLAHAGGPVLLGMLVLAYQKPRPLPLPGGYLLYAATIALLVLAWAGWGTPRGRLAPLGRGVSWAATLLLTVPLGVWLLSAPATEARASIAPREIRLVDYNIHSAVNDGQVDLEALASTIEARRPSIVVVQEASRGWPVTGMTDVIEWLSWRLRMPYLFAPAGDGPFGNTILYRPTLRIVETEHGSLPQGQGLHPRSYLSVTFAGGPLRVIATHLDGEEEPRSRLLQIDALVRAIGDADGTVVAGDLNAEIGSPELAKFQDLGFVTVQDLTGEWTATFPEEGEIFDHILIGRHLTATDVAVVRADVSDHFPVVATIRRL